MSIIPDPVRCKAEQLVLCLVSDASNTHDNCLMSPVSVGIWRCLPGNSIWHTCQLDAGVNIALGTQQVQYLTQSSGFDRANCIHWQFREARSIRTAEPY
jgi:hypothetical protein